MNHWAVKPNAFTAGEEMRNSITLLEKDQTIVCPKPRRFGLLRNTNTIHHHHHHPHPVRSLRFHHFSHQVELCESKAETDILDIILMKDGVGGEQEEVHTQTQAIDSEWARLLCGSPPSRVANPLTQEARFRDSGIGITVVASSPAPPRPPLPASLRRGGGCIRGNNSFGSSPAVRIEGFDCLDRDSRNCSIPALA